MYIYAESNNQLRSCNYFGVLCRNFYDLSVGDGQVRQDMNTIN